MGETWDYLKMFATFPLSLRRFLKDGLTLDEAQRIVRERMEHRDELFIQSVEQTIYNNPRSPYHFLLKLAGCELGDLRTLVEQKGVEGSLLALRDAGVYVTYEEFKSRQPMVRHGQSLTVRPEDFDNPTAKRHFTLFTGGSTGAATAVAQDLDSLADRAPHTVLTLAAHGNLDVPTAFWRDLLPSSTFRSLLGRAYFRRLPRRWFTPSGRRDYRQWFKYDLASYYMIFWMRALGVPVPMPEVVTLDRAVVIARWAAETVKAEGRCLIHMRPSRALRVALAAQEAGLDLHGVKVIGSGEAPTPAKVRQIEKAGMQFVSTYASIEAGAIASGCAQPTDSSDVHVFKDAYALIAYPHEVNGLNLTVPAFNLTTLRPGAPKVMLNVEVDDYGIVEERSCGCALEACGYTTHLREIRSYSKLTGEGVTLIGNDMIHILEEVLPARFGGSALDYQLMEEEDEQGFTRLSLIISPRVPSIDEAAVIAALLNALSETSAMADAARVLWQNAKSIQVKRREPILSGHGKLMPLHIQRRTNKTN